MYIQRDTSVVDFKGAIDEVYRIPRFFLPPHSFSLSYSSVVLRQPFHPLLLSLQAWLMQHTEHVCAHTILPVCVCMCSSLLLLQAYNCWRMASISTHIQCRPHSHFQLLMLTPRISVSFQMWLTVVFLSTTFFRFFFPPLATIKQAPMLSAPWKVK